MGKKLFIPLSIEQQSTSRKNYFFTTKKGIMLLFIILPSILWVPRMASLTPGSIKGLLIGLFTYAIFFILFIRFVIFEEATWKKIFNERERYKLSSHKYFWGIDRIDNTGLIHYRYSVVGGVKNAVIVKLIQGYDVGRGENYHDRFRYSVRVFMHELLREGYSFKIYRQLDEKSVPEGIKEMYRNAEKIEDDLTKEIALEHINNLAYRAKTSKTINVTYLVVTTDRTSKLRVFYNEVNRFVNELNNSRFFKECKIIEKPEVEKFIVDYLSINTFPTDTGEYNFEEFSKYGDIVRVFDDRGYEDWVEGIDFGKLFEDEDIDEIVEDVAGEEDINEIVLEDIIKEDNVEDDLDEVDETDEIEGIAEIDEIAEQEELDELDELDGESFKSKNLEKELIEDGFDTVKPDINKKPDKEEVDDLMYDVLYGGGTVIEEEDIVEFDILDLFKKDEDEIEYEATNLYDDVIDERIDKVIDKNLKPKDIDLDDIYD